MSLPCSLLTLPVTDDFGSKRLKIITFPQLNKPGSWVQSLE